MTYIMKTLLILLLLSGSLFADDPFRTSPPGLAPLPIPAATPAPPAVVYIQAPIAAKADAFEANAVRISTLVTTVVTLLGGVVLFVWKKVNEVKSEMRLNAAKTQAQIDAAEGRVDRQSERLTAQGNQIVDVAKSQVPPAVILAPRVRSVSNKRPVVKKK
jgi:hypothetical protein